VNQSGSPAAQRRKRAPIQNISLLRAPLDSSWSTHPKTQTRTLADGHADTHGRLTRARPKRFGGSRMDLDTRDAAGARTLNNSVPPPPPHLCLSYGVSLTASEQSKIQGPRSPLDVVQYGRPRAPSFPGSCRAVLFGFDASQSFFGRVTACSFSRDAGSILTSRAFLSTVPSTLPRKQIRLGRGQH